MIVGIGILLRLLLIPAPAFAITTTEGDLLKSPSDSAVYYIGTDRKRYVFPNERIYKSWYASFSAIRTVSAAELTSIPLAGVVPYRPGHRAIKVPDDPKVYLVTGGHHVRWITTEAVARQLLGFYWNQFIDDLPASFFVSYRIEEPITAAADINIEALEQAAPTISAARGLGAPTTTSTPPPLLTATLTLDSVITEPIPPAWLDQFHRDFTFAFEDFRGTSTTPARAWTTEERELMKTDIARVIYVASRLDSNFSRPLPWTDGRSFYQWFNDGVKGFILHHNPNQTASCCSRGSMRIRATSELNRLTSSGPHTAWMTRGLSYPNALMRTIIHEARHAKGPGHVTCPAPGETAARLGGGSDLDLKTMGGYGLHALFLHWMRYFLPEAAVQDAIKKYGERIFHGVTNEICTVNPQTLEFNQEDRDWLRQLSGYPPIDGRQP